MPGEQDVMRDGVARHDGFVHEGAPSRFTGHQLCDAGSWLHAPHRPIGQSFHRNAAGRAGVHPPAPEAAARPGRHGSRQIRAARVRRDERTNGWATASGPYLLHASHTAPSTTC
ncbi:hypothetical protein ACFCX0_00980 [Streptomyces sp. NPDC056352]|uniref:hypothetical protein n=1 Tax=Streptomyces sp. NPDC056352 TaxID=3345791 RepID=UPI0035D6DB33